MNEELSEYYEERVRLIRSSSWTEAFLYLIIGVLGGAIVFAVGVELTKSEQARETGLVFLGAGAAYLALRYGLVWYRIRRLKQHVAVRAMTE